MQSSQETARTQLDSREHGLAGPWKEAAVKTKILDDKVAAKRAAKQWAREKEGKAGSGVWMWWKDGSRTDDGRVGAMALYTNGDGWTVYHSYLGKGGMEVLDAALWPFGIVLRKSEDTLYVSEYTPRPCTEPDGYPSDYGRRRHSGRLTSAASTAVTH
jgi:hypothetical protein